MKVLVIDDDPSFGHLTKRRLERLGHDVEVHIGAAGTASLVADRYFDVVVMDVEMPGMSGPDLIRVIRDLPRLRYSVILLYSSLDTMSLRRLAEQCGAHGYLNKSASTHEFDTKLRELRLSTRPPPGPND